MSNDVKDNAEGGVGQAAGANANGTNRVPGAALYQSQAVLDELGAILERIGAEIEGLGRAFGETGRLLPQVDGNSAAIAISGIKIEIRHARDLLSHLEINL